MSRRMFIAVFAREEDLLGATRAARDQGLSLLDVYTPYAVHGLDHAMGLAPSRLSRVCLLCGLLGTALAFWFQYWTMTLDWPVNVGGRPWNSWPAFVPVGFEVMVLFAGFGVVFAFLAVSRLFPGKRPRVPVPEVTSNRFCVVVEEQATFDVEAVRNLFQQFRAVHTEEREEDIPSARRISLRAMNWVMGVALVSTVLLHWLLGTDPTQPNQEFLPDMVRSVPYDSFSPHSLLPDKSAMQAPEPGTIARGQMPLHYRATPADAVRAGVELINPLAGKQSRWLPHGAQVYGNYCQVCHGAAGQGDGPVATAARLGKWSLVDDKVTAPPVLINASTVSLMASPLGQGPVLAASALIPGKGDGQLFHIVTYGRDKMASYAGQLSREDRWAVILYIRSLQKKGGQQ